MKQKALVLACIVFSLALHVHAQTSPVPVSGWSVSYTLIGPTTANTSRQLLFISFSNGTGTFRMIGPRTATTTQTVFPAVYDWVTTDFISFSSEVELPIGNCCRETGTLIFKGERSNTGQISGPVLFIVNAPEAAGPLPYIIRTGSFVATPLPIVTARSDRAR
jgi:hypothetical protein